MSSFAEIFKTADPVLENSILNFVPTSEFSPLLGSALTFSVNSFG